MNSEELVVRSACGGTSCPQSISVTSTRLSHVSTLTSVWFIFNPQSRSAEPKQIRPNSFTLQLFFFFFFTSADPYTYCIQSYSDVRQRWSIWRRLRHLTPTLKTEPSVMSVKNPLYSVLFVLCWGATRLFKWFGFGVKLCALAFEKGNKRTKCSNNSVKGEGRIRHSGSRSSPSSSSAKSSSSPRFLAPVFGLSIWGPSGSTYEASAR